jgi:hypothetical protein
MAKFWAEKANFHSSADCCFGYSTKLCKARTALDSILVMAFNLPRAQPFANWDEWIHVKNGLYSSDHTAVCHALTIVALWRLRGRLPLSIDSTANLVELRMRDSSNGLNCGLCSENEMKLHYSSVIVRAVNGLVDPSQQGMYATSVLTLAEKMGLPGWIVELRHDATHNQVPSLSVLRNAGHTLFNWLYDFYWAPQFNLIQSLTASSLPTIARPQLPGQKGGGVADGNAKLGAPQDCSPTYVSQIFAPLFVSATLHSPGTSSASKSTKSGVEKEFVQQRAMWGPRLADLFAVNGQAVHLLVINLLMAVRDILEHVVSPQEKEQHPQGMDAQLGIASLWIEHQLNISPAQSNSSQVWSGGATRTRSSQAALKLTSKFVGTLVTGITPAIQSNPSIAATKIIEAVSTYYRLNRGSTAGAHDGDVNSEAGNKATTTLGKRKISAGEAAGGSNGVSTARAWSLNNEVVPPWPLGCVPGANGCGDLYMLEDA